MLEFFVDKIFDAALAVLGFSVLRHYIKRFYPESYERVLDAVVAGVFIIGVIVSFMMTIGNVEDENFHQLIVQAGGDSRKAVDELQAIGENPTHRFHNQARGIVDSLSGSPFTLHTDDTLVNELQELGYAELLHYYHQAPQVQRPSVLFGVHGNTRITEEEKTDFLASIIQGEPSFRVAQRACLLIKTRLERYQQANSIGHDKVLNKCRVYGKIWRY
jgi:hypothetical protein